MNMNTEIYTGEVVRLAFGGDGIVHQNSLVIFVPFTAPGDLIRYQITQRKNNFAHGQLLEVINPSSQRTLPRCPYFGTCGGCQLQHLKYEDQLEHKRQSLEEALARIAKVKNINVPAVTPATNQWAYRRRINLALKPHQNHFIAGYMAVDNTSLINIQQCPIFTPTTDPIINIIQHIAKELKSHQNSHGKVTILKIDLTNYLIHFHFNTMPSNAAEVLKFSTQQYPQLKNILATAPKTTIQFGSTEAQLEIDGLSFAFSPKAFIQNHPEQSKNIYNTICRYSKIYYQHHILDLYCGIGISTLLLGRDKMNVIGVENNAEAIRLAKKNAELNHIIHARFVKGDVQNLLASLLKSTSSDLVIVNPPREGLDPKVTKALQDSSPKTIFYISCMPPTLARDIKHLTDKSYSLSEVLAFDMFPQTSHLETLAILLKK